MHHIFLFDLFVTSSDNSPCINCAFGILLVDSEVMDHPVLFLVLLPDGTEASSVLRFCCPFFLTCFSYFEEDF